MDIRSNANTAMTGIANLRADLMSLRQVCRPEVTEQLREVTTFLAHAADALQAAIDHDDALAEIERQQEAADFARECEAESRLLESRDVA